MRLESTLAYRGFRSGPIMNFLESHHLPATACFVLRHLSSRPNGIAEYDLPKLLAPRSLEGPAGKEKNEAGGYAVKHTIGALKSICLIEVDKSRLLVAEPWRPALESAVSDRQVLRIVRRAVFASPESSSCWDLGKRGWDTSGANGFIRAACWFLAQDPLGLPFAFDPKGAAPGTERLMGRQFKDGRPRLLNQTSWDDFGRWACALGLARRIRLKNTPYLTPDPTHALAETLASSLDPGKWYSIGEALNLLAKELPIVGPGILRSQMLEHLQAAPEGVGGRTEDATLSQAIIILADKKFLEFKALSDAADQRLLWDRPAPQSVTQLRLLEA